MCGTLNSKLLNDPWPSESLPSSNINYSDVLSVSQLSNSFSTTEREKLLAQIQDLQSTVKQQQQ